MKRKIGIKGIDNIQIENKHQINFWCFLSKIIKKCKTIEVITNFDNIRQKESVILLL